MNILMHVDIDKSHVNMIILHVCCLIQELVRNFNYPCRKQVFFLHDNDVLHVEIIYRYTTTEYTIILNEHKYTHFPLFSYFIYFPHAIQLILAPYNFESSYEVSFIRNPVLVTSVISVITRRFVLRSESRKYRPYVKVGLSSK